MEYTHYKGRGKDKISGEIRPVTYLPNISEWVGKIYCLEDETDRYSADDVLGGVGGVDNAQGQALANRTYFLKDSLVKMGEIISAMQLAMQPMLTTIKKLVIQQNEVTDYLHEAWLYLGDDAEAQRFYRQIVGIVPELIITFEGGSYVKRPIFELSFEDGRTFFIRTDGVTVIVPKVEDFLDFDEEDR